MAIADGTVIAGVAAVVFVYIVAALLLIVAGGQKLRDPRPLVRVLHVLGLPLPPLAVQGFALLEIVIGVGALAWRSPVSAAALASSYAVFTGFTLVALSPRNPLTTCGCFGGDTPPSRTHAVLTFLGCAAAIAVAVASNPGASG
ncbi:MAG TPA: MauE/DoxX family redox-associated membrane protein [Mycobacteriales bacterium]|nr:MauE/DoxX family redox-associated membrane protein [Mycobacteriales bacterium]